MKKTTLKTRLWALAATLLLLVSLLALPVSAANVAPTANLQTTFNKYLVMDANANVPNAEFEFTITAGSAVDATTGSSRSIYAGNDALRVVGFPVLKVDGTGNKTTAKVNFVAGDTTYGSIQDGDILELGNEEKYAKKTVTVAFNDVDFNAPGIYRYIITEKNDANQQGISYDDPNTRTLDVFVEYENVDQGTLKVSNYVLYPGTKTDTTDVDNGTKDDGFTNTYTTYDLTLAKTVTGNQGDRDKYFEFTVNISGAVNGTVYTVDLSGAEASPIVDGKTKSNLATLTATNGSVEATYYLKHGQSIVIQGLTADTKYTIAETSYSTDGYSTAYNVKVGEEEVVASTTSNSTGERTMSIASTGPEGTAKTGDHTVIFTNDKQGTVPTGILLETAPYLILGAVVVAGLVVLFATRRRRSRE